ncbi:hypothetical protein BC827DRAFT_1270914 [Russula dissimulans]|nr:hypothetical protein BC827DRAFT_1270914 [Russula dissimulans]
MSGRRSGTCETHHYDHNCQQFFTQLWLHGHGGLDRCDTEDSGPDRQRTVEAIDEVIDRIKHVHLEATRIVWVRSSLRNMKDYGGISAERLQVLEERLRDDVVSELHASGGKLLLHTETPDGSVIPVLEEVRLGDVAVVKDVMSACEASYHDDVDVSYHRVRLTAKRPPDTFLTTVIQSR